MPMTIEEKKAKAREATRLWTLANRDRARESCRRWREANTPKDRTEYFKNYREKNLESERARGREKHHRNKNTMVGVYRREYRLLQSAKVRAKKYNREFNIDISDIIIPTHCPILGIPIVVHEVGTMKIQPDSPSLDRIDNSKGYIKGNVKVISMEANRMKGNHTKETLQALLKYLETELPVQ